jgi:hypothetical protein
LCKVHSIIGLYILHMNIMSWKHVWHTDKCVDGWNMNECHMNFASYKFVCQICFQCMILVCETMNYEWTNFVQFPLLSCEMLNLWYMWWKIKINDFCLQCIEMP